MKPDEAEFKITMTNLLNHFLAADIQYNGRQITRRLFNWSIVKLVDIDQLVVELFVLPGKL